MNESHISIVYDASNDSKRCYCLKTQVTLARSLEDIFPFFATPHNLEQLTPDFLRFKILTSSEVAMKVGLTLDYSLSLYGIPFKWQSVITVWEPGVRFVDEQAKGPYRFWKHEHRFENVGEQCIAYDTVYYSVYGGFVPHEFFVKPSLRNIFEFRRAKMIELFGEGQ